MSEPFFSIGITTYDRHDLLKQLVQCILAQSFVDFEIIVGNDCTAEILTCEMLGIDDPRLRIVNHPKNLREVGNMNALLSLARGRYFTWMFDDDLYEPGFFLAAHEALRDAGFPPALFPSYRVSFGPGLPEFSELAVPSPRLLSGRQFLADYSRERIKLISTCGLFDTRALRALVGGMEEVCDSAIGLYSEYLFLVRCALLEKILYLDAPFAIFRVHDDSWGESNTELDKYREAGVRLLVRSAEVLRSPPFAADLDLNLGALCRMHLLAFATKSARYELARGRKGPGALYRSWSRFRTEATRIRQAYLDLGGSDASASRLAYRRLRFYCFRLMLAKLRDAWLKRCP